MKIEIDFSEKGLSVEDFSKKAEKINKRGLDLVSHQLLRNLIQKSPVDTGLLRGWFQTGGGTEIKIESPAAYVGFVNEGTGIYGPTGTPITPKKGEVLKFQYGGQTVFAKSVKGQKGQKFVEKSIKETSSRIEEIFKAIAEEEL